MPLQDASFLTEILNRVAHPVFVKDPGYRFVYVNRALADMAGVPAERMIGRTDYDFFPKAEADFFRLKDAELFRSGSRMNIDEESITDAQGRKHVLATTKVPLEGPDGQVAYLVGIIHDITRLKAAEDALRLANEHLERRVAERTAALEAAQEELLRKERLALLGQLAGGVAHQIRNPLAAIANAAYLLRHPSQQDPDAPDATSIILEEVEKANRTVTALLDHARARPAVTRTWEAARLFERALASSSLPDSVTVVREFSPAPVAVDGLQVQEALGNLIRNAVEAMSGAGRLRVSAREVGGKVFFRVQDEGPGIPEELQARLFEPLTTTKQEGVGLGLSTARMLVENQGGGLRYVAECAPGACFEIWLPAARQDRGGEKP